METKKRYPSRLQIRFLWLLVTLFATTFVYAQNSNDSIVVDTLTSGEPVYDWRKVDQKPEFPEGIKTLSLNHLHIYYKSDRYYGNDVGICGIVQFVIDKDGNVKNPKILRSLDFSPKFKSLVLRSISIQPRWKPALLNGKAVETNYAVPITLLPMVPKANDIASVMKSMLDLCNTSSWDNVWIDIEGKKSDSHFLETIDPNNLKNFLVLKNTASVAQLTSGPKYKAVLLITLKKSK